MNAFGTFAATVTCIFAAALACALAFMLTHCGAPRPTPAQGAQWLDYARALEACDTVRDAGVDARMAAFDECVKRKGLER